MTTTKLINYYKKTKKSFYLARKLDNYLNFIPSLITNSYQTLFITIIVVIFSTIPTPYQANFIVIDYSPHSTSPSTTIFIKTSLFVSATYSIIDTWILFVSVMIWIITIRIRGILISVKVIVLFVYKLTCASEVIFTNGLVIHVDGLFITTFFLVIQ